MLNRVSALCLVVGAIGGYALAGSSAAAQGNVSYTPDALAAGNTVRLRFERGTYDEIGTSLPCIVGDVQGQWVRCKSADSFQDGREQRWYSLQRVILITKQEK